ncbi:MAG: hypothetical protein RPR97_13605 [Colwellia sp.]|jgi:hypothetical protein
MTKLNHQLSFREIASQEDIEGWLDSAQPMDRQNDINEQERIETLTNLTYYRAMIYCRSIAKDNNQLDYLLDQNLKINCQKIAYGIFSYEKDCEFKIKFTDNKVKLLVDDIINVIELNTREVSNIVVMKVSDFMRSGVAQKLRIITGRMLQGVPIDYFENMFKESYDDKEVL